MMPRHIGVQRHQPDGPLVHHLLDKVRHRPGALGAEDLPQIGTIIVVSGNQGVKGSRPPDASACCRAHDVVTASVEHMGVYHRCAYVPMSEESLDSADVIPGFKEMGRKDVTRAWEW
jgi:hypothetical protein